jgi:hypothetical protein
MTPRLPERRVVRTPKESLQDIFTHQLDSIATLATQGLLGKEELEVLKTLKQLMELGATKLDESKTPAGIVLTTNVEELRRLAKGDK